VMLVWAASKLSPARARQGGSVGCHGGETILSSNASDRSAPQFQEHA
jgi:hypothetical protein